MWVTISFAVFEAGCCAGQYLIDVKKIDVDGREESVQNSISNAGLVLFNIFTTIVLLSAVHSFRKLAKQLGGLHESQLAIYLHVGLFILENVFMVAYIVT